MSKHPVTVTDTLAGYDGDKTISVGNNEKKQTKKKRTLR